MKNNSKHIFKQLSIADCITLLAMAIALAALWLVFLKKIDLAISLVFLSMYLDYLDGVVARKYGSSNYGKIFDSLYDTIGWVVLPSLIINIEANWSWWSVLVSTVYCLFSVVRLARFTVDGYLIDGSRYYIGLPVLFSRYALALVIVFNAKLSVLILLIMIPLMVSRVKIKKPHFLVSQLDLVFSLIFLFIYLSHAK